MVELGTACSPRRIECLVTIDLSERTCLCQSHMVRFSDAEGASQAAQRRAFFVGAQNLFALSFAITKRLRIVTTAAMAVFTVIALFAISGQAVAQQIFTAAMAAFNRDCNHRVSLSSLTLLSHYPRFISPNITPPPSIYLAC